MKRLRLVAAVVVVISAAAAVFALLPATAHEGREIGGGEFVATFGWRIEPTYTDLFNGPEFTLERHDNGQPIIGADATLRLEVMYGGQSKVLRVRPVADNPGHYTADLIPTQPGDYSFRLSGTLNGVEIDETFSSTEGEFDTVEPISDIQFP